MTARDQEPDRHWWEKAGQLEERIANTESSHAGCSANVLSRMDFLTKWKEDQNGDIKDIRDKFSAFETAFNLFRESSGKWLLGLLTAVIMMLLAVVANIVVVRAPAEMTTHAELVVAMEEAFSESITELITQIGPRPAGGE